MDPIQRFERKGEAQRRQRAQRRRAGLLRSRVVAISLIGFVFLWAVVFVQMATGNDPVLGSGRSAKTAGATRRERKADRGQASGGTGGEASDSTEPIEPEPEYAEPEYVAPEPEAEYIAPEPEPEAEPEPEYVEPEPAPVITSQS